MTAAGGHPSDEDRERAALPVLERTLAASRAHDLDALAECYDEDVVWLAAEGASRGRAEAVARHSAIAASATGWAVPQQAGAKATLRWSGAEGAEGAIVVEVRRGRIIFVATA